MAGSNGKPLPERDVFLDALEIADPAERHAFLDRACADDPALRQRVEALLKSSEQAVEQHFLDGADGHPTARDGAVADDGSGSPAGDGARFGDYELREKIASGAMGVVWRARQVSLNRPVAVKMIRNGILASDAEIRRFRKEAESAAGLHHPNIVQIHEVGEFESQHFFSMELIEGGTFLAPPPGVATDRRSCVSRLIQVAHALSAAHRAGLLHRDIKPGNILIDRQGVPHLTDFGIARSLEADSDLTLTGQIVGTAHYMAPEQALGNSGNLTTATDVFSLGVILYEVIGGRKPFPSESLAAFLREVAEEKQPRLRTLDPTIDRDIDTIVEKCLEKSPANRYPGATELAHDLQNWLDGRPISSRPVTPFERLAKWARRKPVHAALAGTSAVLVLVLAIGGPVVAYRQSELKQIAAERADTLRRNLYRSSLSAAGPAIQQPGPAERILELTAQGIPGPGESDLRGWEWYYLRGISSESEQSWRFETRRPSALARSATGGPLAVGTAEGVVYLIEPDSETPTEIYRHPLPRTIEALSWDAPGERLAIAARDGAVIIWERSAKSTTTIPADAQDGAPVALAWSPDGTRLACGDTAGHIRLFAPASPLSVTTLSRHRTNVTRLAWSPDGSRLLSTSLGPGAIVWSALDSDEPQASTLQREGCVDGGWSPDGRNYAVLSKSALMIFDAGDDALLRTFERAEGELALAWSPDSQWIATGGYDEVLNLWSATAGAATGADSTPPARRLLGHTGEILSLAWDAASDRIASLSSDKTLRLWDPHKVGNRFSLHREGAILQVAWDPSGSRLAVSGTSPAIDIILPGTGAIEKSFKATSGQVKHLAWAPDGERLASASASENSITLWPLTELLTQKTLGPFYAPRQAMTWFPGRDLMHTHDQTLWAFTGRKMDGTYHLDTRLGDIVAARWNPQGSLIAVSGLRGAITLFDPFSGHVLHVMSGHSERVYAIDWSPDGSRLATASLDGTVNIWDVTTGSLLHNLDGHTGRVWAVSWHPQGNRLATGSADRTVRIWNPDSGDEILTLRDHLAPVRAVAWSPDGTTLVSGDEAGKLWIHRAPLPFP